MSKRILSIEQASDIDAQQEKSVMKQLFCLVTFNNDLFYRSWRPLLVL